MANTAGCTDESDPKPPGDTAVELDTNTETDTKTADLGPTPSIQVLPGKFDYGEVELGKEYTKLLHICNVGTAALHIDSASLYLPQAGVKATPEAEFPKVIAADPFGGCETGVTVYVEFQADLPLSPDIPAGVLLFKSNDPAVSDLHIPIHACQLPPTRDHLTATN